MSFKVGQRVYLNPNCHYAKMYKDKDYIQKAIKTGFRIRSFEGELIKPVKEDSHVGFFRADELILAPANFSHLPDFL